jgi:hypothetical protein
VKLISAQVEVVTAQQIKNRRATLKLTQENFAETDRVNRVAVASWRPNHRACIATRSRTSSFAGTITPASREIHDDD